MGAELMRGFFAWAGSRGAERASVTAYAANEIAIRFYESERFGVSPKSLILETELE